LLTVLVLSLSKFSAVPGAFAPIRYLIKHPLRMQPDPPPPELRYSSVSGFSPL